MGEGGEKLERESEGEACGRGAVMMDTPDRSRIATPISKFEDSPVFNYINNLSPIETVKPVRISQTFNSYSFTSVPPIFTSPHVSSLKETRFLRRHQLSDPSKPENGNKLCTDEGATKIANKSEEQQESFDPVSCIGEPLNEAKLKNKVPHIRNYDCCGPEDSTMPCHGMESKCVSSKLGSTSGSVVPFVQEGPTSGLSKNTELINGEEGSSDWVNLISDAADFLVFESPSYAEPIKGSFHKSLDSEMELHTSHKTQADGLVAVETNDVENSLSEISEGHLNEIETAGDILARTSLDYQASGEPSEVIENESASNLQRGIRRRCLVFEMGGARRMYVDGSSSSGSSTLSKSHIETDDKQLIPLKPDNNSSRCILPGIGLHLNALARNSKEYTANHDNLASQRKSINDPSSNASIDSFTTNQETVNNSLALISMERDVVPVDGGRHGTQDAYQVSGYLANDDFNQGSPKKKKRKLENGETEGCKRCNCKKSKCLKLYCECFAAGVYCVEPCSCQDCFNKPIHEDTVLSTRKQIESRNPLAFAPKVIRTSDFVPETGDESINTPASARHKRGCNCKKSGCLKKYCECYQGGVGCSINCRCEGCKNAFGRKDGSSFIGVEAEVEGTETHEKSIVDRNMQKNLIPNGAEQNPDSALPATPLRCGRASVQLPFSSKGKPPRSFLSIGSSSSTVYGGQKFGIPNFLQPQPKFEKRIQTSSENDIPEILQGNCSPINGIKSGSPNSKRVSPPHCDSGSLSPARRSSRKLILQSIPSFPSLKD